MSLTELIRKVEALARRQNETLEDQTRILEILTALRERTARLENLEARVRRIEKLMNLPPNITEHGSSSE